jgi:hypothetical protein
LPDFGNGALTIEFKMPELEAAIAEMEKKGVIPAYRMPTQKGGAL